MYNNKLPLESEMEEQPSLVFIVESAALVGETVPVFVSNIKPAPFPKYQWDASL